MKFKLLVNLLFLISGFVYAEQPLDSLLFRIDTAIQNHETYSAQKEERIRSLKNQLDRVAENTVAAYELNAKLYDEYRPYICDSAIYYKNRNIDIATHLNDIKRLYESKLHLTYLMSSAGMYMESVDLIQTIDRHQLPDSLLVDYFDSYGHVYSELAFYTQDNRGAERYWQISNRYRDSLNQILKPTDYLYYSTQETSLRNSGKLKESLEINDRSLEQHTIGTREFAIACYNRSLTCRVADDKDGEKYYLALSALSDILSSTKDHASLWMLAEILYGENDIERAYNYIRFSWNETIFYNARLRSLQSAVILSLIDKTYQAMIEKQNDKLQNSLILISMLVVLLSLALFFIYRQMKRLFTTQKYLQEANMSLNYLNRELKQLNEQLRVTNLNLSESNRIKEDYIGHFIKLCSTYIDKLDSFRRVVNKKIIEGQASKLLKITQSQELMDNEIAELYINFDKAFLQIFPDFVEKVNELLVEEGKISLKKGELLNTELRILALIRLGINNSSQIADFLRYSVNTIYNYRAKVKNRAVLRDEFEDLVLSIR
ncbi:DUF6377 domain-containing protein [Parabacteroides sp. PF5-9]|uniref:DUF6377 domain-containing protein n=1 Tax=Parabacteroides sp. PF5-9 TaxID=1742404 RepID=UPI0024761485|nr:DUF6377 domain-containing protein [Parabacteroides sp. PF5-9]MDH6358845.1 DNA-binding CsgD family transcriptional regulator/cell division protein FtsL [Parabacteroides sp. PF5-9]